MNRISRYRPLLLAAAVCAVSFMGGCGSNNVTAKEENRARWNETRLGVLYQLALQQYQVGDYDKCKETLAQAIATGHPHALINVLAAKVALEKGTLEDAANYLKTAVQIDANIPEAYYLLGVTYQRWQNNKAAHDYYKLALDHKPNEALYLLAVIEMKIALSRNDEAQALLEEKLVYFEQSAGIRAALAKLHTLKKEYDLATPLYREATILSPDDVNLRESYAESLYYSGRYADVLPILEDLRNNPDVTDKKTVTTLLGESYLKVKRVRDSRTVFAEQTREDPNDNAAWVHLGMATLELEDYQQSSGVALRVLKTEPENVDALVLLALSRQRMGQWEGAQEILTKARSLSPKDPTILCMMGLGAEHLGQKDAAVSFYSQAVDADPRDMWAQELFAAAKPIALPAPAPDRANHRTEPASGAQSNAAVDSPAIAQALPGVEAAAIATAPPVTDSTPASLPQPIIEAAPVAQVTPAAVTPVALSTPSNPVAKAASVAQAAPTANESTIAQAKPGSTNVSEGTPVADAEDAADTAVDHDPIPSEKMQANNDGGDVDDGGGQ